MYFNDIHDKNELKKRYRKLAFQYHPDRGGDAEIMKAINAEYDEAVKRLTLENADGDEETVDYTVDDGFRDVINQLIHLDGLEIELCGAWLWIGGETRRHKDALKAAGCKWASKKKLWYWRPESAKIRRSTGIKDMSYIHRRYGCESIRAKEKRERMIPA